MEYGRSLGKVGGHPGTEWIPIAKRLGRVEAVDNKVEGQSARSS